MECRVDKMSIIDTIFFVFNRDTKATEPALEIYELYGQEEMRFRMIKDWLKQFKDRNFDLADIIAQDTLLSLIRSD